MKLDDVDPLECDRCGAVVDPTDATRSETMGDLDPTKWQTLDCPHCGERLKTVFVGDASPSSARLTRVCRDR